MKKLQRIPGSALSRQDHLLRAVIVCAAPDAPLRAPLVPPLKLPFAAVSIILADREMTLRARVGHFMHDVGRESSQAAYYRRSYAQVMVNWASRVDLTSNEEC